MKGYFKILTVLIVITIITMPAHDGNYKSKTEGVMNFFAGSMVLYNLSSPALATIEHIINRPITYGDCRVKNILPTGVIVAGVFDSNGRDEPHVRTYSRKSVDRYYDVTCPACEPKQAFFMMGVKDYKVQETLFTEKSWRSINAYLYIRTALFIKKIIQSE